MRGRLSSPVSDSLATFESPRALPEPSYRCCCNTPYTTLEHRPAKNRKARLSTPAEKLPGCQRNQYLHNYLVHFLWALNRSRVSFSRRNTDGFNSLGYGAT